MRISLVLMVWLFSAVTVFSQNVEFTSSNFPTDQAGLKKATDNVASGDKYFMQGPSSYQAALRQYLDAYKFNPDNARLNYQIGTIYREMNDMHRAAPYFERAIALDPSYKAELQLPLAETYHLDAMWDKAIASYRLYLDYLTSGGSKEAKMDKDMLEEELWYVNMKIRQAENGKLLTRDTVPIFISNMGEKINSKYPDYSAVVNADENMLVFTSRRTGSTGNAVAPGEVFEYEDIYFSTRTHRGTWETARKLVGEVNTKEHDAAVWISAGGDRMIVYRPTSGGDLYESKLEGGQWSRPAPLKMINSKYRETHACYSPDGNTLYFTSNNPKYARNGSLDVLRVTFDEETEKWSEPEALGPLINTDYEEDCVFIKSDGKTMYFSSQGHNSIGGFDIFRSDLANGEWSAPVNVGYPINSPSNDVFIFFSDDGRRAYFDSDRAGGVGEKDVYEMFILDKMVRKLYVQVFDAETKKPLQASIDVVQFEYEPIHIQLENTAEGNYSAKIPVYKYFSMSVTAPLYKTNNSTFSSRFNNLDSAETDIRKTVFLERDNDLIVLKGIVKERKSGTGTPANVEITHDNRLVQVIVTNPDGTFEVKIPRNREYTLTALQEGFMPSRETMMLDNEHTEKILYLDRIEVGSTFVMKNIYFDYDKATLRDESKAELELLKAFLQRNPTTKIEISAHTDNKGSRSYNARLSLARAKSVVDWLMMNGMGSAMLTYKGYGFDKPVATNDTDEGRQLNRRVEFKILSSKGN